jgi:hypothetical protein
MSLPVVKIESLQPGEVIRIWENGARFLVWPRSEDPFDHDVNVARWRNWQGPMQSSDLDNLSIPRYTEVWVDPPPDRDSILLMEVDE